MPWLSYGAVAAVLLFILSLLVNALILRGTSQADSDDGEWTVFLLDGSTTRFPDRVSAERFAIFQSVHHKDAAIHTNVDRKQVRIS